jgi:hypothetical protein
MVTHDPLHGSGRAALPHPALAWLAAALLQLGFPSVAPAWPACSNEARNMLAEIYGWFTEGFEFADLKDSKA